MYLFICSIAPTYKMAFPPRQASETPTARLRISQKQSEPYTMRGGLPCFASSFLAT